ILVPQQVLVPYVQTTTTGPIRVTGTQETQILNMTSVTSAVGAQGSALAVGAAQQTSDAAAGPQTYAECIAKLRIAEQRIKQLTEQIDSMNKSAPAPKSTDPLCPRPTPVGPTRQEK